MKYIKEKSIGAAWLKAIELIINNGQDTVYDNRGRILEEIPVIIEITNPDLDDNIIGKYGNPVYLDFMSQNFQEMSPILDWGYSYAQRLYNYDGLNQIDEVIQLLSKNSYAKSATINLLNNTGDIVHKPCLTTLDFKVRNNRVIVCGFFRSQDIGKKMYTDAIELFKIGRVIANKLDIPSVSIIHLIASAHVYQEDVDELNQILKAEK